MKAREAIRKASFEPKDLAVIGAAFDETWAEVAHCFDTLLAREAARLVLANAILECATNVIIELSTLKHAGLSALTHRYPRQVTRSSAACISVLVEGSRIAVARSQVHIQFLKGSILRADA